MLDGEFKAYHFATVDLVEKEIFGEEQVVLDDNDDKVFFLTETFQCLMGDTEAASERKPVTKHSQLFHRRLHHLESSLRAANTPTKPLAPGLDLDNCLIRQSVKQVGHLQAELLDITHGILLLDSKA